MQHLVAWILTATLGVGCAATPGAPREDFARPAGKEPTAQDRLPSAVRPFLTDRMYVHGEDLRDLNWAVLFLDRPTVREIAERISEAPRFAPANAAGAADRHRPIPDDFLALQSELAARARVLFTAAASSDPVTVSAAYGRMVQTCVRCHDRYLDKPPARAFADGQP